MTDTIEAPALPVMIHAQYVKDLSFENPNATDMLRPGLAPPEMDMNIDIDTRALDASAPDSKTYEVELKVTVGAKRSGKTVFLTEVVYGAIVSVKNDIPDAKIHALLFVEVPQIMFPFARHAVAMATQSGGYPPLMLNPVDFRGLYMARFAADNKSAVN